MILVSLKHRRLEFETVAAELTFEEEGGGTREEEVFEVKVGG